MIVPANNGTPGSVELHIEELILHGFAPTESQGIGEAVESELRRLLAEQGLPAWLQESGDVARLDAGGFRVSPGTKAAGIGAQVAQAVYQSGQHPASSGS